MTFDSKTMQKIDPVKRQETINSDALNALSPMGNAEDFKPVKELQLEFGQLHPFFQMLYNEHVELNAKIEKLNQAVSIIAKEHVLSPQSLELIKDFLDFFHNEFVPHNKKEEKLFFPLLHNRLLATQEHSQGKNPFTGVKILEDDHIHALRLGAILSNLVYLVSQINDFKSKNVLVNEIRKTSNELAECLELHIFREDHIVFGLGQKLLTRSELDQIHSELN